LKRGNSFFMVEEGVEEVVRMVEEGVEEVVRMDG
jgi:hypothetical protein